MSENMRYSMKKRGGALFYFKDGVVMSDEDVLFDLNMLNDTNNTLKSDRHKFEEATNKINDLICDAIVEMYDGKIDYAEKLLNEVMVMLNE